jgi:hypothetical protein
MTKKHIKGKEKKYDSWNGFIITHIVYSAMDIFKHMSVYKKQIGGSHYKDMKIQPSEFINKNKLLFAEGNAIKYICRHAAKGEVKDLEKAKHYIDMIIERDYS